jgi:hypothetical protein
MKCETIAEPCYLHHVPEPLARAAGVERFTRGSATAGSSGRLEAPRRGMRKRVGLSSYRPFPEDTTRSGAYLSPSGFQATTSRALPDGSSLRWEYGHLLLCVNSEHAAACAVALPVMPRWRNWQTQRTSVKPEHSSGNQRDVLPQSQGTLSDGNPEPSPSDGTVQRLDGGHPSG